MKGPDWKKEHSYISSKADYDQKVKHDNGKVKLDLLPVDALEEIAKCLEHGANEYGTRSWESDGKVKFNRMYSAILRHLFDWWQGKDIDDDSKMSHLAHVATNALILLSYSIRNEKSLDNRICKVDKKSNPKENITF